MAIIQSNESELNEDLTLGPGKRLRDARIARNLEIEDVATRLRLHVRTIKSIEADEYVALPAPTFVRGYLRGYARLLGLPCGPIVESYARNDFAPPPLVPDISTHEEIKSTDFPVRLVTYAIVGALIIFVSIWWQNQQLNPVTHDDGESAFAPAAFDTGENIADLPIAVPIDDLALETAAQDKVVPASADNRDEVEVTPDSTSVVPDDSVRNDGTVDLPSMIEIDSEVESIELTSTDADVSLAGEDTTPVETVATEAGVNHLKIVFSHESWVEIYGENDKRLFYDLAKAGSIIDMSEPGRLRVLLGYAQGVKVEFNGSPFDLSSHTTAGVARFAFETTELAPIAESQYLPPSSQQQ